MIYPQKAQSEIFAYILTVVLVFAIMGRYGKLAIEWILMKLYEFFIQGNAMEV